MAVERLDSNEENFMSNPPEQPTVAIIGASEDRSKFGNQSVRAHHKQGYKVYPVNPKASEIEGLTVYASINDIPEGKLNRISLYVPPKIGIQILDDIANRGCDELWLNPGTESAEILQRAEELGLNVIQACSIVDVNNR